MSESIRTPDTDGRCPDCNHRDWDFWTKYMPDAPVISVHVCETCGFSYRYDETNDGAIVSTPGRAHRDATEVSR
jgi:uncharacterized protein (DUF983 family)